MMDANSANQIAQRFCCQDVDGVTEFPVRLNIGRGDYISFLPRSNPDKATDHRPQTTDHGRCCGWSIRSLCGKIPSALRVPPVSNYASSPESLRGVLTGSRVLLSPLTPLRPPSPPGLTAGGEGGLKRGFVAVAFGRRYKTPSSPPFSPVSEAAEKVGASPPVGRKGIKEKLFLWWRRSRHHKNNILIPLSSAVKRRGRGGRGKKGQKRFPQGDFLSTLFRGRRGQGGIGGQCDLRPATCDLNSGGQ